MIKQDSPRKEYNLTIYTENNVGLLSRICLIFTRRQINVESLNASPSEVEGIHRFNILIYETVQGMSKLARHLEKLTEVLKVYYHTNENVIWQELAMYKVATNVIEEHVDVERLLRRYGARTVAIRKEYTVFEVSGQRGETDELTSVLQPYGLIEFVRSARLAIIKDSEGFNRKLREFDGIV
ncbi:acetolactate synthase small subunit [Chitinophaga ginsengisoli]|uniref:Acetolactate synthase small subunit n=1 Tax=Chitinophaga ginsengisoli TaxID=363837 RepID=A0A2P8G2J6_9BACT|nr:acetolactate synthase small subunit [Chitinophaga ginsengisoli]PSL28199.1 acetolactate synthase small subunit [Chitinophaga ginsengisoli]